MWPVLTLCLCSFFLIDGVPTRAQEGATRQREAYLSWNEKQAVEIGKAMRDKGRVGGWFDARVVHTEHSYNYKLRATWLTPEVIRATARLMQIQNRLTDDETRALVAEAESAADTVVLVEVDPREGSGIIPRDWIAVLQPKDQGGAPGFVRGVVNRKLRKCKALSGVMRRDYDYDIFWMAFSLVNENGEPLFSDSVREAELVVRISNKEGRVAWPIPQSVRNRSHAVAAKDGTR